MISNEQARRAAELLQTPEYRSNGSVPSEVPCDLLAKVRLHLDGLPEYRHDRVEAARARITTEPPTSHEIAVMMIGRIVSDRIR